MGFITSFTSIIIISIKNSYRLIILLITTAETTSRCINLFDNNNNYVAYSDHPHPPSLSRTSEYNSNLYINVHYNEQQLHSELTCRIARSSSGDLHKERRGPIAVPGVVGDLFAAHGTGGLSVEPHADAQITEDVSALECNRTAEGLVTDGALVAHCVQLIARRSRSKVLNTRKSNTQINIIGQS